MTAPSITIAGEPLRLDEALERLERYPARTPKVYDYPGPGEPSVISGDEIARTRAVSSRISHVEGEWFTNLARTAPWTPVDGDLRDADPAEAGGFYDAMLNLYNHFAASAPKGVNLAKISKVLHLKRPTQSPILDSRLVKIYGEPAARAASTFDSRGMKRMHWAAIRTDLEGSADGLAELRRKLTGHQATRVRALQGVSDLRLLDVVTW
jgi:hypothetical protein